MVIAPTGTLKTWLLESGRTVEALQGFALDDLQMAYLDELREQSQQLTHYDAEEKEAWALFTAYTHVGFKAVKPVEVENVPAETPALAGRPVPAAASAACVQWTVWLTWIVLVLQLVTLCVVSMRGH